MMQEILKQESVCCNCGRHTREAYADGGALAISHGLVYCRTCYFKLGYTQCERCFQIIAESWQFCPHCGEPQHGAEQQRRKEGADE